MKKSILFGAALLMAGSLFADPKDDIVAAAKKLADKDNYSWKATSDFGPNSQFTPGPTMGKTEKDGFTTLSVTFNDNTSVGVAKAKKVAVKTEDGWQTGEEAASNGGGGGGGGGFNPGTMMARRMQTLKVPAAEAEELASKVQDLKKEGEAFTGQLTEDAAKEMATMGFGRRRGGQGQGQAPGPSNAKGSVKFWIKDGALTKYETKVTGTRKDRDGNDVDFERTTTIEIKDVGTTKMDVPDEAKKKLS